jgi:RNA polymerase sigma factor (TIGR02999 family)
MPDHPGDITVLLSQIRGGRAEAAEELIPLIYGELKKLAASCMRDERPGATLQPTALVHEVYLRLIGQRDAGWQNRAHFFGLAASLMRRILLDSARRRHAAKRGSGTKAVPADLVPIAVDDRIEELLIVDQCLERLAAFDEQQARLVEMRFFAGLTVEEIAEVTGISAATVKRELASAKAWLHREMTAKTAPARVGP